MEVTMKSIAWIKCPICGRKLLKIFPGQTRIKNLPTYCRQCKQESFISYEPKPVSLSR
ncbi:MAG: cysteine-rich KTR domain-containing protein [Butyricicoccaceae bacterium]